MNSMEIGFQAAFTHSSLFWHFGVRWTQIIDYDKGHHWAGLLPNHFDDLLKGLLLLFLSTPSTWDKSPIRVTSKRLITQSYINIALLEMSCAVPLNCGRVLKNAIGLLHYNRTCRLQCHFLNVYKHAETNMTAYDLHFKKYLMNVSKRFRSFAINL